ncbi:hypothetical protein ACFFU1_10320 [Algibacter miyuki]|uniref:Lipoprotein n=1 Tax=Algibacter miyuki TaxID=1306933 RepID=A0ABV5H077_9FLAO|nr:hypothetical protein [Algibacter miyuki]MDN3667575.1 hypothetical protein [Algibacter miyuki]
MKNKIYTVSTLVFCFMFFNSCEKEETESSIEFSTVVLSGKPLSYDFCEDMTVTNNLNFSQTNKKADLKSKQGSTSSEVFILSEPCFSFSLGSSN